MGTNCCLSILLRYTEVKCPLTHRCNRRRSGGVILIMADLFIPSQKWLFSSLGWRHQTSFDVLRFQPHVSAARLTPRPAFCRSYFEVESSGVREEIRYHYRSRGKPRSESFPYRLADGLWHKVALTVSASHLLLHVDCNR